MSSVDELLTQSLGLLIELDVPKKQQNDRTARVLLALLDLKPKMSWEQSKNPMLTIRGIADFIRENLEFDYAENSRESLRKYSVKQLVDAGILLHNPDDPRRAVNSSKNCYQVDVHALKVIKKYQSEEWERALKDYQIILPGLATRYAKQRELQRVPLKLNDGQEITLSPGAHSELIKQVVTEFGSLFVPGGELVYVGDTGKKWGYFDEKILSSLGLSIGSHGKMPDVVLYDRERKLARACRSYCFDWPC